MGAKSQVQKSLVGCGPKLLKNRWITVAKDKVTLDEWTRRRLDLGIIAFSGFRFYSGFKRPWRITLTPQTLSRSKNHKDVLSLSVKCVYLLSSRIFKCSALKSWRSIIRFSSFFKADGPSRKVSTDWWRWYTSLARAQKSRKISRTPYRTTTSSAEGKAYFSLVALHACSDPQDAKTAREEPGKSQSSRLSQNNQCWKEAYFKQMRCEN
jgi:hypothetical protein